MNKTNKVNNVLIEADKLHKERSSAYENPHSIQGETLKSFFPDGINLKKEIDFARYSQFQTIVSKLKRYSNNFQTGGHRDSLIDVINYCTMLINLDDNNENS